MNIARVQQAMLKRAGAIEEAIMDQVYTAPIPVVGQANAIGGLAGMLRGPATAGEEEEWDNSKTVPSYLPGTNAYRLNKRLKRQTEVEGGGTPHFWSQKFGPLTSIGLLTALGALGGGVTSNLIGNGASAGGFATAGGLAGLLAGLGMHAIGEVGAAITPTRTAQEQKDYANSSTAKEWLIPGYAPYNKWKSIGRSAADSDERDEKRRKEKEEKKEKA